MQFSESYFESLDNSCFLLPASVEVLSISGPRYRHDSGGSLSIAANAFPPLIKELYLKRCKVTSDTFEELHLRAYKNLEALDLLNNKISRLENNIFPLSLQYLRLDENPISAVSTPNVFSELKNLRKLIMSGTLGLVRQSRDLPKPNSLVSRQKDIANYLQSDQANMLNFPSSLISLNLSNNHLQKGVALKLGLLNCCQLQEVCLGGNREMTDIQIIVDQLKSSSPNMVELFLDRELQEYINEGEVSFLNFS